MPDDYDESAGSESVPPTIRMDHPSDNQICQDLNSLADNPSSPISLSQQSEHTNNTAGFEISRSDVMSFSQSSEPSGVTTEPKLNSDVEMEDADSVYPSALEPVQYIGSQHDSLGSPTKDAGLEDNTCSQSSQPTNLTSRKRPHAKKDSRRSKRQLTSPSAAEVQRLFILYFIVIVL